MSTVEAGQQWPRCSGRQDRADAAWAAAPGARPGGWKRGTVGLGALSASRATNPGAKPRLSPQKMRPPSPYCFDSCTHLEIMQNAIQTNTGRPCAGGREQSQGGPRLRGGGRRRAHSSSCLIRCERRVRAGFCEPLLASEASAKNLKMDGKLFQEVSSWRSVPAETRGQSGSMDSTDVSSGSELETQLQQFSLIHSRMVLPAS